MCNDFDYLKIFITNNTKFFATITGPKDLALCNNSAEITSSCRKGVFELYMEETR
jgi:hypothetical protein